MKDICRKNMSVLVQFRCTEEDYCQMKFLAVKFARGRLADWLRYASVNSNPMKDMLGEIDENEDDGNSPDTVLRGPQGSEP